MDVPGGPGDRGCCGNGEVANFPLLSEEGRLRDQEKLRSILSRADGVVISHQQNCGGIGSPPRPLHKGCFAIFYWCRGHPSSSRLCCPNWTDPFERRGTFIGKNELFFGLAKRHLQSLSKLIPRETPLGWPISSVATHERVV